MCKSVFESGSLDPNLAGYTAKLESLVATLRDSLATSSSPSLPLHPNERQLLEWRKPP